MNFNDIKITPLIDTLYLQKISDEVYFSEEYSNYISNSRLGYINPNQDGSPEKFFEGFKPIYSSSLDIGSAVHGMILQPEAFNIVDSVDKPTGKMGVMAEELFKIWKGSIPTADDIREVAKKIDYYGGNLSDKRVEEVKEKCKDFWITKNRYLRTRIKDSRTDLYLDPKSRETACNCITAIKNSKQIQKILHPEIDSVLSVTPIIENEQAILLDIQVDIPNTQSFILRLKAKLDNYVIDILNNSIQVNDIKTLGRIVSEIEVNIEKYHYNREISFYCWLLSLVASKFYNMSDPTISANYLVVSTIPQYYTKVVPMNRKMFTEGWNEIKYLLRLVAKEVATNHKEFAYKWI